MRGPSAPRNPVWPGWLALILWTTLIFALSSFPGKAFPTLPGILPWDKFVHAAEWGVWAFLCWAALARQFPRLPTRQLFLVTISAAALLGALDEFHQLFVPGRSCDPIDWAADMLGAAGVAWLASYFLTRPFVIRWRKG